MTLLAGGALVVAACGGCSTWTGRVVPSTPPVPTVAPSADLAGARQLVAAGDTALGKFPYGTVTSIGLDRGGTVWQVHVMTVGGTDHQMRVRRDGAMVVSRPLTTRQSAYDRADDRHQVHAARLEYPAAAAAVLAARTGEITRLSLGQQHGTTVWMADVHHAGTTYRVTLNAVTGKVIANSPSHGTGGQ